MKLLWAPWRIRFILDNQKATDCVFCTLPKAGDDRASLIVHRSKTCFVILNKFPYNSGHLLVVPFMHTAKLSDLPSETLLDMHATIRDAVQALEKAKKPEGFNIGMNLGEAGGAGIRDHLHYHIVPRWNGDTNYMPVLSDTKVLPESLTDTLDHLAPQFRSAI